MARLSTLILALCLFMPASAFAAGPAGPAKQAPSPHALELRQAADLVPYAPPGAVLDAYFTADEDAPKAVYGPVSAYAKSRACSTSWLMERGELARVERLSSAPRPADAPPFEFSLTLEEDCQGHVTHSVFVAAPGRTPESWLKWRRQFHGSKAQAHYGATMAHMQQAAASGLAPVAELRFVSVDGDLVMQNLDERLRTEGRLAPVFDLTNGLPSASAAAPAGR